MAKQDRGASLKRIESSVRETLRTQESFFADNLETLGDAFDEVVRVLRRGGKLLIIGNGGSAADAQHLAAEFVNRYRADRPTLPAIALTTDTSVLTSIANDSDYRYVFSRQIEALGRPEDLVLAITTSGNSGNIVEGIQQAKAMGIRTLALTGGTGGYVKELADVTICVSVSDRTPRIQETLLIVEHLLCEWIEGALFPSLIETEPQGARESKR
jgi:D-sedoheptulose 7-phosphate isomerase